MDFVLQKPALTQRFTWNTIFSSRQDLKYPSEDRKLDVPDGSTLIDVFLDAQRSRLDPPQYNCVELEAFLRTASEPDRSNYSPSQNFNALVDDRRDSTGWQSADQRYFARDWDGYSSYPPEGIDVHFEVLDADIPSFIQNPTSTSFLIIAMAVSKLQAAVLRDFMQRYIANLSFVSASLVCDDVLPLRFPAYIVQALSRFFYGVSLGILCSTS